MPQADVQTVTKDPNFLGLPTEEKRKVLSTIDPNFKSLPPKEQDGVLFQMRPQLPGQGFFGAMGQDVKSLWGDAKSALKSEAAKPAGEMEKDIALAPFSAAKSAVTGAGQQIGNALYEREKPYPGMENDNPAIQQAKQAGRGLFSLAGGSPENIDQRLRQDDKGGAFYELAKPAIVAGAAEAGSRMLPHIFTGLKDEETVTTPTTRKNVSNIGQVVQGGMPEKDILESHGVGTRLVPALKQAAQDLNLSEADLDTAFPAKEFELTHPIRSIREYDPSQFRVQKGVELRRKLFDRMAQNYSDTFGKVVGEYKDIQPPPNAGVNIAGNVRNAISSSQRAASKGLAQKLDSIADELSSKRFNSLAELDEYRKSFGNQAEKAYEALQLPGAGQDLDTVEAYRHAADAIRDKEYDLLAQYSGMDKQELKDFQRMHGDAVEAKFAAQKSDIEARLGQSVHQNEAGQRIATGTSGERSVSVPGALSRSLKTGPQGKLNRATRKALTPLGEGAEAPSVTKTPRTALKLPPPSVDAVEIPTEVQQIIPADAPTSQNADWRVAEGTPPPEGYEYQWNPNPKELPTSEFRGKDAGTIKVTTPEDAQTMLRNLEDKDFSHLDSGTQAKIRDTIDKLRALSKASDVGPGVRGMRALGGTQNVGRPGIHKMRINPGLPGHVTRRTFRELPPIRGIVYPGANQVQKQLPNLEGQDR